MLESTQDFPILSRQIHGKSLVYLDNAATSQKPKAVIDALTNYYTKHNANVHRGVHTLSDESTHLFETSKATIAKFFGAQPKELIFTQNTTQAINAVAYGWGEYNINPGDMLLVSVLDHHSNIVVWQELAKRKQATLLFVAVTTDGLFDLADFQEKLKQFGQKIKLVAVPHVSNALGTVVPIAEIVARVNSHNSGQKTAQKIRILVDGAQSAPHMPVHFSHLGVDFYAFSGHKMLGPMGVGGLLVREELLASNEMRPWLFGGGMIAEVHESHTLFHDDLNERFSAGTPDVASVVGLAAACDYVASIGGMHAVLEHDVELVNYALRELAKVAEVAVVGLDFKNTQNLNHSTKNPDRVGSVAFLYKGVHAHDVAQVLDSEGIAVRSGHHCTMPLHLSQHWVATTRASFQVYNTQQDIDALVAGLQKVRSVLG